MVGRSALVSLILFGLACSSPSVPCPGGLCITDETDDSFACDVQIVAERSRIACSDGTTLTPPRGVACTGPYTRIDCDDGTRVVVQDEKVHLRMGSNTSRCANEPAEGGQRFICDDGTEALLPRGTGTCTSSRTQGTTTVSCAETASLSFTGVADPQPGDIVACDADLLPTRACRRDGADGCQMLPEIARHLNVAGVERIETTETDAQAQEGEHDLRIVFRLEARSRVDLESKRGAEDVTTTCLSALCDGECIAQTAPASPGDEATASAELEPGVYYLRVHWSGAESWSWSITPSDAGGGDAP